MKRSLPPRRGDAEVLGSAWATMPSVRRLGALLECLHEPSFVSPFQGLDRWWACQPGALPRAGVCRAVGALGSWQASQAWGRCVGRWVDFDGPPHPWNPTALLEKRFSSCLRGSASRREVLLPAPIRNPMVRAGLKCTGHGCLRSIFWIQGRQSLLRPMCISNRWFSVHSASAPRGFFGVRRGFLQRVSARDPWIHPSANPYEPETGTLPGPEP